MSEKKLKGRLTLTGNKMPEEVYNKLEQLGSDRKLTPYVVSLVEKEKMMDTLIENLSTLITKVNKLDERFDNLELDMVDKRITIYEEKNEDKDEKIKQGDLKISENIMGGIEEEIEDMDF